MNWTRPPAIDVLRAHRGRPLRELLRVELEIDESIAADSPRSNHRLGDGRGVVTRQPTQNDLFSRRPGHDDVGRTFNRRTHLGAHHTEVVAGVGGIRGSTTRALWSVGGVGRIGARERRPRGRLPPFERSELAKLEHCGVNGGLQFKGH